MKAKKRMLFFTFYLLPFTFKNAKTIKSLRPERKESVYAGKLFPQIKVGMTKVNLLLLL